MIGKTSDGTRIVRLRVRENPTYYPQRYLVIVEDVHGFESTGSGDTIDEAMAQLDPIAGWHGRDPLIFGDLTYRRALL